MKINSGSELMVKLMALKEHWFSDVSKRIVEPLEFKGIVSE